MRLSGSEQPVQRDGIPREVVAWLRSLQLPRAVRYPKRDLSNGFLVALICSRYWDNISMHSYEDRMSAANKRRNWDLLKKQFALNKYSLSEHMVDGMIMCRDNYANSFLRQLFTLLTGRVILEAAPLPAEEVTPPQTFVPTSTAPISSTTINVEFAPSFNNATLTASRVRELPASNITALEKLDSPPSLPLEDEQHVHAISNDQLDDLASDNSGNRNDGKPPIRLSVSLRRADTQKTVVRNPSKGDKQKASLVEKEKQQQLEGLQPITNDSTPLDLIEFIVRSHAGRQDWPCGRDTTVAYTDYFLRNEETLGALLQCRVWSALLGSLDDVKERIFRQGVSISDMAALFLQSLPSQAHGRQQTQQQQPPKRSVQDQKLSHASSFSTLWKKRELLRGSSPPQRYAFLAALLSSISDIDAFLAVSLYCEDILPHSKAAMSALDNTTVENYASLLTAALPANPKLAARLLPDVLSAVYNATAVSNGSVAKSSFYLLLSAVLPSLRRGTHRVSTQHSQLSPSSVDTLPLTDNNPLLAVAFTIAGYHVVAALSHECSTVRLVGAYLAETLVSTGCPLSILFTKILPLLSTCCASSSSLFKSVCAAWLLAVLKRVKNLLGGESNAMFKEVDVGEEEKGNELCLHALPSLATMMRILCDVLRTPVAKNVKVYIAEQLALCLENIPADEDIQELFNADGVAVSVISVFQWAPPDLLAAFVSSASSQVGRSRGRKGLSRHPATACVGGPVLGPLVVHGSLSDCYPLALSEAVLATLPPGSNAPSSRTSARAVRGGSSSGGAVGASVTSKRILAGATSLLRDRVVPVETSQRVTWMYRIIVDCRSGLGFPERPASLSETAAAQRWNRVMRSMYYDIALLTAAAEMMCAQKEAMVDGGVNAIAQMAGMAQQIVLQWHTQLGKKSGSPGKSSPTGPSNVMEQMTRAMEWYREMFDDVLKDGNRKS